MNSNSFRKILNLKIVKKIYYSEDGPNYQRILIIQMSLNVCEIEIMISVSSMDIRFTINQ